MSSKGETTLTIIALAYREGEELRQCFSSLTAIHTRTAAETLIILDSNADSLTKEIARKVADHVITVPFVNFSKQRNTGLASTTTEWVFFIDADERMTVPLADEISRVIASDQYAAYNVPRRNILFGHEVRHTGWSPDYQIRLLKREKSYYDERRAVHEVPQVDGAIGTLKYPLVHYNYRSWRQFIAKQRHYAPLEAEALYSQGHSASAKSVLGQPLREFKRRYVDYKGYADGLLGLELSLAMAAYKFLVYWRLRRMAQR